MWTICVDTKKCLRVDDPLVVDQDWMDVKGRCERSLNQTL